LPPKITVRGGGVAAGAQAVVERDDVQHVEQLPLVFVDALDLHVEQGIGIDLDAQPLADDLRQARLVVALDAHEGVAEGGVVGQRRQLPQLVEVLEPALADAAADQRDRPGLAWLSQRRASRHWSC
jgi:hypothetical protein